MLPAAHGAHWSRWIFLASHGVIVPKQAYPERLQSMERTHTGAGEKCEEE